MSSRRPPQIRGVVAETPKMGDGQKKRSAHSDCPREHLKDKPVDGSCSVQTRSRATDDGDEGKSQVANAGGSGNAGGGDEASRWGEKRPESAESCLVAEAPTAEGGK